MFRDIDELIYHWKMLRWSTKHNNEHEIAWYQNLVDCNKQSIINRLKFWNRWKADDGELPF